MTLLSALGLIFIILKLVGVIVWSWWIVLLPFYAGLVIWAIFIFGGAIIYGVWSAFDSCFSLDSKNKNK